MNIEILTRPGNAAAKLSLGPGETCTAEGGSMIAMDGALQIQTTTHKRGGGSLLRAAKRMLAGESFFLNHYTAPATGGDLYLAPTLPGDMTVVPLNAEGIVVQSGSFVACEDGVDIDMGWQGFKSMLSGERMFWLEMRGTGQVVVNSFGAIYAIDVEEDVIVDTGHIVAFEETLDFSITKAGSSWVSSFLGGEGLVCKFKGRGKVWCQSHNATGFGKLLGPKLKPRQG